MNKLVKIAMAAGAALASVPAFAQSSGLTIDTTTAENAADAVGTAISGLMTGKIMTNVLLVVGAALAIWGLFLVVKYVRRGAK